MIEEGQRALLRPGPVIGLVGAQIERCGIDQPHHRHRRDQRRHGKPRPQGQEAGSAGRCERLGMRGRGRRHGAFSSTPPDVSRQPQADAAGLIEGFNSSGIIPTIRDMDGMAATSSEQIRTFARGIGVRQVRLASGVILFAYLVSHFLNHALGNISMDALAAGVLLAHRCSGNSFRLPCCSTAPASSHTALGIWALYERRQFRWKTIEITQLVLGLSIPLLVIAHIIGVRLGQALLRARETLSAGILSVLRELAAEGVADARGADGRLGAWLHRALFLAAHEAVLQARRAVPARGGGAAADARHARHLSGRPHRRRRDSDEYDWRVKNLSVRQVGTKAEAAALDRITEYSLLFYLGPSALRAAGTRRARSERAPRRHDQPVLRQRPHRAGAEGPERAGGEPAQQRAACLASAAAARAARPAASA